MKINRLAALILLAVTGVCGFFAWFKQKDQDEMEEEASKLRHKIDKPGLDEDWLHRQRLGERP